MSGRSHYDALGLQPSATKDEIREAFERLSSVFDADSLALYALVGAGEQEAEINRVREAHGVLADPEARRAYDESHGYTPDEIELGDADIVSSKPLHGKGSDGPHEADAGAASGAPADPPAASAALAPVQPPADPPAASAALASAQPPAHLPAASAALASVQPPAIPVATSDTLATVQQLAHSPAAGSLIVSDPPPVEPPAAAAFASEPPHFQQPVASAAIVSDPPPAGQPAASAVTSDVPPVEPLAASAAVAIDSPPAAPVVPEVDEDTEFTGELLRALREARGLTLKDIAARTRIGANYLQSIEEEAFDSLPERVFLRGFLISFARELKLDAARVADTYLRRRGR